MDVKQTKAESPKVDESMAPAPAQKGASTVETVSTMETAVATPITAQVTQMAAMRDALPSLSGSTALEAVVQQRVLMVTPVDADDGKDEYMIDESTKADKVPGKTAKLFLRLVRWFVTAMISLKEAIPTGTKGLVAVKDRTQRNNHSGVYALTVAEKHVKAIIDMLAQNGVSAVLARSMNQDYEVIVPNEGYFPGKVIAEIAKQTLSPVSVSRDPTSESKVYRFSAYGTEEQKAAITTKIKQSPVIVLGDTTFDIVPAAVRTSKETVYLHGCTGKASAEERVGPELARALGCSIHEINFTLVQEVAGTAVVLAVQYPWSSDRYDQVAKFLDIAQFKFKDPMNGRVSHLVITDTLAAMAMLARVPMRKQLEDPSSKGEDEDEIEVVDLKPLLQVTYPGKIDRKNGEEPLYALHEGAWWSLRALAAVEEWGRSGGEGERPIVSRRAYAAWAYGDEAEAQADVPPAPSMDPALVESCNAMPLPGADFANAMANGMPQFEEMDDRRADESGQREGRRRRGGRERALPWTEKRRMERLLGWGWAVTGAGPRPK